MMYVSSLFGLYDKVEQKLFSVCICFLFLVGHCIVCPFSCWPLHCLSFFGFKVLHYPLCTSKVFLIKCHFVCPEELTIKLRLCLPLSNMYDEYDLINSIPETRRVH